MQGPMLMVDADPAMTRVLLVVDGVERLRATLPWSDLSSLARMVDGLASMLGDRLSVVLCAGAWGASPAPCWSENCDEEHGCNVGHLDCRWARAEFARMHDRLRDMGGL